METMKRIVYLFSIRKETFIFKATQKAIFKFFPNKYKILLKESTRNIRNKLMLYDNSSTTFKKIGRIVSRRICNIGCMQFARYGMDSLVVLHILSSYRMIENWLELIISGTKSSSLFKLYSYWRGSIKISSKRCGKP